MEQFDAGGQFNTTHKDSGARLPDSTEVTDFSALQTYLAGPRIDRVVSALKHWQPMHRSYFILQRACVSRTKCCEKLREKGSYAGCCPIRNQK